MKRRFFYKKKKKINLSLLSLRAKKFVLRRRKLRVRLLNKKRNLILRFKKTYIEKGVIFSRKLSLAILHSLLSQLITYNRSKHSVFVQLVKAFKELKKNKKVSPIRYLKKFLSKAIPRIFLRDYRNGATRLKVPVPATFEKRRLAFLKQLITDLKGRKESEFYLRLLNEMYDFRAKQGQTYNKKMDLYLISKQNRNYTRYAYKNNSYNKKNVVKKNKFSII